MTTLIVASVGGSPQPIIFSINNQRPDYVIYFVSPDSRPKVWDEIEPALEHRPKDREIIVTSDEQNLNAGVKVLMERLPGIYEQWHIAPEEVIGEFTGGTKAMSSALVLALSDSGARFSYIGGEVRDKAGLGVVMNGKERMFHLDNPWDTMALHDLKVFREKYESFQWQAAAEIARQAASRTEVQRPLFLTLEQMCKGYSLWDNFEHREACNLLQQVGGNLKTIAAGANQKESLYALSQDVRNNAYFLSQVIAEMDVLNERTRKKKKSIEPEDILTHHYLIRDLLSNAKRRAEQRHFDDAVARLYGTVEKIAKIRLKIGYQIDNSNVRANDIPDSILCEDIIHNYKDDKPLKLPLFKSFELLKALGDTIGERFDRKRLELENLLQIRNNSILAHGYAPVGENTFYDMLCLTLDFLNLQEDDLICFPRFTARYL